MSEIRSLQNEDGATLVELVVSLAVLALVIGSVFGLFTSLLTSAIVAKNKSIATTLATNQMEYLKGLPYDMLAVSGGSIYSTNPLPATSSQKINGVTYTITTSINYVDDAFDGCTNYPSQALKQLYCRNYPAPTGSPAVDSSPEDYKIIHVSTKNAKGVVLSEVDTQVAARVAETSSTTGALLVTVIDDNGNPISGSTVSATNSTVTPALNLSDTTDSNGVAIFYGLPPDAGNDYVITASKTGYSTLNTIPPAGALQPTYSNQKIIAQQSSSVTLTIKPQSSSSMIVEAVDTNGAPLAGVKIYAKGGYKKYTSPSDSSYYFDNSSPDTRPTTDASGIATFENMVPGGYTFCGDSGNTNCVNGGTTYYLVGALPYTGANSFYPVTVPSYNPSTPPTTTFPYGANNYLQKVRLVLSTASNFPRVATLSPSNITLASTSLSNFAFQITGTNLPCSSNPSSCDTTIRFVQDSTTYTASCSDTTGTSLSCTVDFTGITSGFLPMTISANGYTHTSPAAPPLGGMDVSP